MALLHFDGFETYDTLTDFANAVKGNSVFSDLTFPASSPTLGAFGRNGTRNIRSSYHNHTMQYTLASNYASFIIGIWIRQTTDTTPSYNATYPFLILYDGSTIQLRFHFVGTEIRVYNGAGTLLGTTSGFEMDYLVARYFEVKVTIDNTTGSVEIRSNANSVLSLSSQDTQNSANAYLNKIDITGMYSGIVTQWDDLYMSDLTGSAPHNDFLGDVRVDILRPSGAGTYTDFTPSAGANYQNVDELYGPDEDSTYNDGANVADQDSYQMPDLPTPPASTTIFGVKSQITVRKTDAGARECKILTRAGTTDDLGDAIVLSESFTTHVNILEDNPDDAAAWEDADVNSMEIGVEVTV